MSVLGEFQRCLRNCVDALRDGAPSEAEPWRRALAQAADIARADLTQGAQQVLALRSGDVGAPHFEHRSDAERFAELFEHLERLCRAIAGSRVGGAPRA